MAKGRIPTVKALFLAAVLPVLSLQPVHLARAAVPPEHIAVSAGVPQVGVDSDTGDETFRRLPSPKAERLAPEPSPNAVLVRWRPGASAAARARDVTAAGGRAVTQLPNGWAVVRGAAASKLRDRLGRAKSVARVEPDLRRRAAGEDVLYGKAQRSTLEAVRWPEARNLAGTPAADLVVAVVDTGVAANHPDLTGRVLPGYDATGAGTGGADDNGHGTAVAGIVAAKTGNDEGVAGVASGASILPVKVLDADGYGYDSDVAEGVRWAADHGADVINMSLSGIGSTTVLADAVAYAHARGVVLVAAVGNGQGGPLTYPASYPNVLSVGATDGSGDVTDFSQWNEAVDLVAPGMGIVTTYGDGSSLGYVRADGTSFSAALVSGAAALLRTQQPTWTANQVAARLTATAREAGPPGRDRYYGSGLLDMAAALGAAARPVSAPAVRDSFEPDDTPARAHPPGTSQWTYASLSPEGDVDWWRFQVAAPSWLSVSVDWNASDDPGGHEFEPSMEMYDANLQPVRTAFDWSSVEGFAAIPGTYYVRVSSVVASRTLGQYNLQWSMSPQTDYGFRDPERYYGGTSDATAMALADMTGDGRTDVVVARESSYPAPGVITVLEQQPDGVLPDGGFLTPPVKEYPTPSAIFPEDMSAGDIDGDGDADLAIAANGFVLIARQVPGGLAQEQLDIPAFRLRLSDVTGDGIADLVTTQGGAALGTYVRAGGAGGFGPPRLVDSSALRHLAAADVDADGDVDLVGVMDPEHLPDDVVHVARQAAGTWSVTATEIGQGSIDGLAAGPLLDGGGAEVVLSHTYGGGDVEVRTVQSGGSLGPPSVLDPTPPGTFQTPNSGLVRLVDVTGDGRLDVAALHDGWGRVEIAASTGTGFAPGRLADLLSHATPRDSQLQLADVNGDQKVDVVQSADGHPVTVLAQRSPTRPTRAWVRNVVPADSAVGVAASVTPQVVLTRTPVASSITAQTVRLIDATSGDDVPATRTWNAASSTLSIDPTGSLVSGHTYELVLSGLVDTAGLPMVLGTAFERGARSRFTVGSPPADTTPPDTVVREVPDAPAVAFLADATEPGTTLQCATSTTGPWWTCNNRSTNLRAGEWTSQAKLYARAVDGGGRADPSPSLLVWDDRGVESPPNDNENTATPIAGASGTVTGTNMGAHATGDSYPGTPDYDPISGASVFYRWTATASGQLALSTEGSDFDTVLSVTRDDEGAKLGRDDDVSAVDRTSRVSVPVVAGHTYLVRVAGFQLLNPRIGAIRLAWSLTPAQNAPPTVAWSAPSAGAVLRDTVDLVATASDDIELSKVEFLQGATVLATATAAPWSHWVDTRTLPDGPTTLTVRATDADGATASANRSFVVDNSYPTTTTPIVSLQQGGTLGTSGTVPVVVKWTSTDTGSGVASHTVWTSVDGGAWGSPVTVSASSVTLSMTPGHSYRFRVQATDRAGHAGSFAISNSRRVVIYENTSSAITWTTRWTTVNSTSFSGGSIRYATVAGERATWKPTTTGIGFAWVSRKSTTSGVADVYVDGTLVTSYDLVASSILHRRLVVARSFSYTVIHTVEVRVRGTANRPRVDVDAFVLLR